MVIRCRTAKWGLVAFHGAGLLGIVIEHFLPFDWGSQFPEQPPVLAMATSYVLYGFTACIVLVLLDTLLRRGVIAIEALRKR